MQRPASKTHSNWRTFQSSSAALALALTTCLLGTPTARGDIDTTLLESRRDARPARAQSRPAEKAASRTATTAPISEVDEAFERGLAYDLGRGVEQDRAEAARWYRKAAEKGHPGAQLNLGLLYSEGLGVERDEKKALRWFTQAAESGNPDSQYSLALMHATGQGTAQDFGRARTLYEQAARAGNHQAMNNLAIMHALGQGGEINYVDAFVWFSLAADLGNAEAGENRELTATEMSEEQRTQATQAYENLRAQLSGN